MTNGGAAAAAAPAARRRREQEEHFAIEMSNACKLGYAKKIGQALGRARSRHDNALQGTCADARA